MKEVKRVLLSHPAGLNPLQVYPDLGLGYLASSVKKEGFDVKLVLDPLTEKDIINYLETYKPDVWGLKLFAATTSLVNKTIDLIKKHDPGVTVIIGGPQVNGMKASILKYVPAHFGMYGNSCELSFCMFLKALRGPTEELQRVPGLIYRGSDGNLCSNEPHVIGDLDILPPPLWKEMDIHKYSAGQNQVTRYWPNAPMMMSRGCNARCRFCNLNLAGNIQRRSPESIVAEMKTLKEMYGVKEILFQDSNFAYDREETMRFCRLIIDRNLGLSWTLPQGTRLSTLNDELCRMLVKAGCYRISIGIEAGDKEMQRFIRKGVNLNTVAEKLKIAKRNGIEMLANFMIGFPGETRKQIQTTLDVALKLPLDYANFYIFTPYPGSSLFDELLEKGQIKEELFSEWNKFTYRNNLSEMTADELERFRSKMVWRFYLRPGPIMAMMKNMRHPTYVKTLLRVLFSHYFFTRQTQKFYFRKLLE